MEEEFGQSPIETYYSSLRADFGQLLKTYKESKIKTDKNSTFMTRKILYHINDRLIRMYRILENGLLTSVPVKDVAGRRDYFYNLYLELLEGHPEKEDKFSELYGKKIPVVAEDKKTAKLIQSWP